MPSLVGAFRVQNLLRIGMFRIRRPSCPCSPGWWKVFGMLVDVVESVVDLQSAPVAKGFRNTQCSMGGRSCRVMRADSPRSSKVGTAWKDGQALGESRRRAGRMRVRTPASPASARRPKAPGATRCPAPARRRGGRHMRRTPRRASAGPGARCPGTRGWVPKTARCRERCPRGPSTHRERRQAPV